MSHRLVRQLISDSTPPMNRLIVDGLATSHIPMSEDYIHGIMKNAVESFPQGIEYLGCERCDPSEEFREVTRPRNNKRTIDIARSDLYLMKYFFRFKGKDLPPRYLYLPYVSEGGTIFLGGSRYVISPVLTDKVISPGQNNVFVRLLRDKVTFERLYHSMIIDGVREFTQIVWSAIYRKSAENRKVAQTTKAMTCLTHYLFCKYGFSETFKKLVGFVPVVGDADITEGSYDKDDWVICKSSQIKPKTFIGDYYNPNPITLAIPRPHWNAYTKSLVSEFFYIVDHFPTRISPQSVDNKNLWMILLGHIIFSGVYGEGKLYNNIAEHFNSLDEYVDNLVIIKLKEIGYEVTDFYSLLALVIKHFNHWIITGSEQVNSLYNKELSVLYHVLFEISSAIFRTGFRLNKIATKKELTEKEIVEVMNKNLRVGLIYSITRSHVNMSTVSYSGDNKFFKITSMMVPQASATNKTVRVKKSKSVSNDPSKKIHESISTVGSYLYLPKTSPRRDSRISPYVLIDTNTSVVLENFKHKTLIDKVGVMLKE